MIQSIGHHHDSTNHLEFDLIDPIDKPDPFYTYLKLRTVHHYGYEFLYNSNTVDPGMPLPGGLPPIVDFLLERIMDTKLIKDCPDQLTVNEYEPGAGWFVYEPGAGWFVYEPGAGWFVYEPRAS